MECEKKIGIDGDLKRRCLTAPMFEGSRKTPKTIREINMEMIAYLSCLAVVNICTWAADPMTRSQ